jgi:hypothetical protein
MKKIKNLLFTMFLAASVAFAPAVMAQEEQSPWQLEQDTQEGINENFVSGQLKDVQPESQMLVVTTPEGQDVEFFYNEQTEFIGAQETIEGLTLAEGSQLSVYYNEEAGRNMATRIHVHGEQETPGFDEGQDFEDQPQDYEQPQDFEYQPEEPQDLPEPPEVE